MIEHAKKQCFAFKDGDCTALQGVTTCKGCRFYKTEPMHRYLSEQREKRAAAAREVAKAAKKVEGKL